MNGRRVFTRELYGARQIIRNYGISDFDSLITEKYYYVDRTDQILLLEEAGKQLLFLRPRRFGKSPPLLSMLENYYDLN